MVNLLNTLIQMSRSYKHTAISSCAVCRSCQWYKQQENRAKRHRVKQLLIMQQYDNMPHCKEYGNEWSSPRDGLCYFGDMLYTRCFYCRYAWHWVQKCECDTREQDYKRYMRK